VWVYEPVEPRELVELTPELILVVELALVELLKRKDIISDMKLAHFVTVWYFLSAFSLYSRCRLPRPQTTYEVRDA